ncbi:cytochrome P450 monooxygenase, partial [Mycena sanguinolenta]
MHPVLSFALPFLATAAAYVVLLLAEIIFRDFSSPLRKLVGPKSPSFVLGHVEQMEKNPAVTWTWRNTFGATFQFKGVLNTRELYTADTVAIDHILRNNYIYQKRGVLRKADGRLVGEGLLGVEGDIHKRQRRIMNPAFGTAQIRSLMGVFVEKSMQLRDVWTRQIENESQWKRINVLDDLSKMTLDVIGQAGFDYHFDSLDPADEKPNEIYQAFHKVFNSPQRQRFNTLRSTPIPLLQLLPLPGRKTFNATRIKLSNLGGALMRDGKAAINAAGGPEAVSRSRDLFSLILRANMSPDIPDDHRMSDNEVIGQVPTFLVAGHATTSTAIAWALHELSINQTVQKKLREELLGVPTDNPTLEELNALPYLDSVIRETLRVHPPVSYVGRIAAVDDVLPLGTPCLDVQGREFTSLPIRKGQLIRVPIKDVNTDIHLWGEDAAQFRPDRWVKVPEAVEAIPAVWGNLLTFLAGAHNCIGFRFSLAEQKALLFVLIRGLEFERAVADDQIRQSGSALQSPTVVSEGGKGQMPLMVKLYQV